MIDKKTGEMGPETYFCKKTKTQKMKWRTIEDLDADELAEFVKKTVRWETEF